MGEVGIPLGQRLGTRQVQIKRGLLSADKTIAPALDQLIGHDPSRAASSRCRLDSVDPLGQCSVQCLEFPLPVVQQIEHLLVGISRAQAISDELTGLRIGNVRIDISNPGDQSAIGEADATTTGQVTETASRQAQRRPGAIQRTLFQDQRHRIAMGSGMLGQCFLQSLALIAFQGRP
ncbi:hypothetical protein D9M71_651930 [compost metagenome]